MAQKHLEQVITTVGLPADKVTELLALPEDAADFKTDGYVEPVVNTVKTQLTADPKFYEGLNKANLPKAFVQQLEQEQYGRAATVVRTNMMKALGLKEADFAELGEEGKKIEVFGPAFAKKLSEGKVTDKELQTKLMEANTTIEQLQGGQTQLEQKYEEKYQARVNDQTVGNTVLSKIAASPGLKVKASLVASTIRAKLATKYALVVVDDEVVLRQKANNTLEVLNATKTKPLTLHEAIQAELIAEDLIDTKKKVEKQEGNHTEVEAGADGLKLGHVADKMKKRLEQDKAAGNG